MAFTVIGAFYYNDAEEQLNAISANDVPVTSPIDLQFSEDVSTSSLLSYAVTLLRTLSDGGNETPVDITLIQQNDESGNPTIVRVTPVDSLITGAFYTIYVPRSSYGITSSEGSSLAQSFSFNFNTAEGDSSAPDLPPSDDVEQLEPIPEELFLLTSTPTDASILQFGFGSLITKFNGRVPGDANVQVETRHPLGYGLVADSWWSQNLQDPLVIGSEIFLSSKIEMSALSEEETARLTTPGTDPIKSDSILVLSKEADEDGLIALDFDVNTMFDITIEVEGNEVNPALQFMGLLAPLYASVTEARMDIGPFVNQYNDFTIALSLYRHSITAEQLWNGTMPDEAPIRVAEYVIARTKRDILQTYFTDPSGVGAGTLALGDLKLSGKNLVQYLKDSISALDMKIVSLESRLKRGDVSNTPYTDHTHMSLPVQTTSAKFGEAEGTNFGSRGLGRALDK